MWRAVTKEQFYDFVMKTDRNLHPHSGRDRNEWIDQNSREIVGISPGYMGAGAWKLKGGDESDA